VVYSDRVADSLDLAARVLRQVSKDSAFTATARTTPTPAPALLESTAVTTATTAAAAATATAPVVRYPRSQPRQSPLVARRGIADTQEEFVLPQQDTAPLRRATLEPARLRSAHPALKPSVNNSFDNDAEHGMVGGHPDSMFVDLAPADSRRRQRSSIAAASSQAMNTSAAVSSAGVGSTLLDDEFSGQHAVQPAKKHRRLSAAEDDSPAMLMTTAQPSVSNADLWAAFAAINGTLWGFLQQLYCISLAFLYKILQPRTTFCNSFRGRLHASA
jgi:hypothetical protein